MHKRALVAMIALCFAAAAFAGTAPAAGTKHMEGHRPGMGASNHHMYNNVTKMTADGSRTALCLCGKEFTVSDTSPTFEQMGTTYYLCSDHCKDMSAKASKEEAGKMLQEWHGKFRAVTLVSNSSTKDGKEMATCFCGKTFEVTKNSPWIIENGVKAYLCSDACKTAVHGMSAADRMQKEEDLIKGADAAPAK